jgi:hypothetical protein
VVSTATEVSTADLLIWGIGIALSLLEIAGVTSNAADAEAYRRTAMKTYDTVAKLLLGLDLQDSDRARVENELLHLRACLDSGPDG